jgi:hypothetical protein
VHAITNAKGMNKETNRRSNNIWNEEEKYRKSRQRR